MAHFNIVGGPSRWDLMLAIFDGDFHHRRIVTFSLDPQENLPIRSLICTINEVGREDGSGENWLFEGETYYPAEIVSNYHIHGFFSTRTRTGWVEMDIINTQARGIGRRSPP